MGIIDQYKNKVNELKRSYNQFQYSLNKSLSHLDKLHAFVVVSKLRMFVVFVIIAFMTFMIGWKYGESKVPENSPDFTTQSISSDDSSSYTIKELPESNYTVYLTKEENNKPAIEAEDIDCPGAKEGELIVQNSQKLPPLVKSKTNSTEVNFYGFLLDMVAFKPQTMTLVKAIIGKPPIKKGQCVYVDAAKNMYVYSVSLSDKCGVREDKKGFSCEK